MWVEQRQVQGQIWVHREVDTNLTRDPVLEEDKQGKEEETVNEEEGKKMKKEKEEKKSDKETTKHK